MASFIKKFNKILIIMDSAIVILMLVIIAISWGFLPDHLKYINVNGDKGNNKIYLFVMPGVIAIMTLIVYLLFLLPVLLGKVFPLKKRNSLEEKKDPWDEEAQMYKSQKNNMDNLKDGVTNGVVAVTNGVGMVTKGFSYTIVTFINCVVSFCSVVIFLAFFAVIFQIDII
ncbi:hypothetical protein BCR32DRAFT_329694 [Anaeromyces robustus]|uniref:Uncharacterized protein n=1 Tax=Anaeromyces robustus TaxID=1754192 RepID=A0A1Y1WQB6_9FUNG|nr:hypothetical protein BCR32DRAFT_329694 [Anaeromyces robustus]|eukprot:ORX75710.1 hypothetical protein BCR32DRAFT_329694 [Anaeromyces robustus]